MSFDWDPEPTMWTDSDFEVSHVLPRYALSKLTTSFANTAPKMAPSDLLLTPEGDMSAPMPPWLVSNQGEPEMFANVASSNAAGLYGAQSDVCDPPLFSAPSGGAAGYRSSKFQPGMPPSPPASQSNESDSERPSRSTRSSKSQRPASPPEDDANTRPKKRRAREGGRKDKDSVVMAAASRRVSSTSPRPDDASEAWGESTIGSPSATGPSFKRVSHNLVERRYRDRLNHQFEQLLAALPDAAGDDGCRTPGKALVLDLARRRIKSIEAENESLRLKVEQLKRRYAQMYNMGLWPGQGVPFSVADMGCGMDPFHAHMEEEGA